MAHLIKAVAIRYKSPLSDQPKTTDIATTDLHQYATSSEAAKALAKTIHETPYCFTDDVIFWDELHVSFDRNAPTILKRNV